MGGDLLMQVDPDTFFLPALAEWRRSGTLMMEVIQLWYEVVIFSLSFFLPLSLDITLVMLSIGSYTEAI